MKTTKKAMRVSVEKFDEVFKRLRKVLEGHSGRLTVSVDTNNHYSLDVDFSPKFGKGFPVAWVKTEKRYVGFHFMPIYMFPGLKDGLSPALRARMQGKSCFNFSKIDEPLFSELEDLTANGLRMSEKEGVTAPSAGGKGR